MMLRPSRSKARAYSAEKTTNRVHSVNNFRAGTPNPDGTIPLIPRPPVWLGNECMNRYHRDEVALGWCENCISWGTAFEQSQCGELYAPA